MGDTLDDLHDLATFLELWGINNRLDRLREEQWLLGTTIVEGVESLSDAVHRLQDAQAAQTHVLRAGFASIDAKLDFQNYLLGGILEALYRPADAAALELRKRGERELLRDHYEEALAEFKGSILKNPYDFTSHYNIAAIQAEAEPLLDHEAAWESCELVLRHTEPHPSSDHTHAYYASLSLLLMGRMLEEGELLKAAFGYYEAACEMSPDYGDCFRLYGRAAALLDSPEQALAACRIAILIDREQTEKIRNDEALGAIRPEIESLIQRYNEETKDLAVKLRALAEEALAAAYDWGPLGRSVPTSPEKTALQERKRRLEDTLQALAPLAASGDVLAHEWACGTFVESIGELWMLRERFSGLAQSAFDQRRGALDSDQDGRVGAIWSQKESTLAQVEGSSGGCLPWVVFWILLIGAIYLVPFGLLAGAFGYTIGWVGAIAGVGLFVAALPVALFLVQRKKSSQKAATERKASVELQNASESYRERVEALAEAKADWNTALQNVSTVHLKAKELCDQSDLRCSLVLVDSRSTRDEYDEVKLAKALKQVVHEWSESMEFSLDQARSAILKAPTILLDDLSVADAEMAASYLRRELGVSVGIKRRYVGPIPPQAENPSEPQR